jgi:serine/threonine-protein kinase
VARVEGEIAGTIARILSRQLGGKENDKLVKGAIEDPEAYRLYLKGRELKVGTLQEMDKAVEYLQQAAARSPDYALAHAGLADVYTRQAFLRAEGRTEVLGKARAAVNRALGLDPDLAEGHAALALVRFYFEWDWAGAEAEFLRAETLNPGAGAVHEEFGNFLNAMGRLDEGVAQSQEAARLDPLSVGPIHDIAINHLIRGDFEGAAAQFRRTIELDPDWTWGYIKLARSLAHAKKCAEALPQADIAETRIASGPAPLSRSWPGVTYALCGEKGRARRKLDELEALARKQYVDPITLASVHAALGELDEAVRLYEKAFEDRTPNMVYAGTGAVAAPNLAADPRYQAIVRRMNFPPRKG